MQREEICIEKINLLLLRSSHYEILVQFLNNVIKITAYIVGHYFSHALLALIKINEPVISL